MAWTNRMILPINPLSRIPKVIVEWVLVDQNSPGRENSKMNLKETKKTLSEALTVAASKEKCKNLLRGLRSTYR